MYEEIKAVTKALVQTEALKRSLGIIAILNSRCSEAGFQISQRRQIKFCVSDMSLGFILVEAIHQFFKHKSADLFY